MVKKKVKRYKKDDTADIYIINNRTHFKIGYATNIKSRLKAIQTASLTKCAVSYTRAVPQLLKSRIEKEIHGTLDQYRHEKSEWFACTYEQANRHVNMACDKWFGYTNDVVKIHDKMTQKEQSIQRRIDRVQQNIKNLLPAIKHHLDQAEEETRDCYDLAQKIVVKLDRVNAVPVSESDMTSSHMITFFRELVDDIEETTE